MYKKIILRQEFDDIRFDKWFKNNIIDIPQSLIEKIIKKKKIKINKKKAKSSYRLKRGDLIELYDLDNLKDAIKKRKYSYIPIKKDIKNINSLIVDKNDNFLVIDKPQDIPVQSGTKSSKNIIDILKNTNIENKNIHIVHRLDKETTGVMIFAKNKKYAQLLTSLFRIKKIHKTYLAIVHGEFPEKIKTINDNLIYYEKNKKIEQRAITNLKILKKSNNYSFLELNPITGRKHQLRKHLFNLGFPIYGDKKYNYNLKTNIKKKTNLLLHAYKLKFIIDGKKYTYKVKLSNHFQKFLDEKFRNP